MDDIKKADEEALLTANTLTTKIQMDTGVDRAGLFSTN